MINEEMQQVSADELLSVLSGSTDFGKDELVEMFSYQDDQNKDFCIYHRLKAFCVPLHKIREYFTRNAKPIPPMTKDQELIYLREKVEKLQTEVEDFQARQKSAKPAPDETEALAKEPEEGITPGATFEPTEEEKTARPAPPSRDESIPPPGQREKKSLKEIRADLATELKDAKNPKKKTIDFAEPKDIKDREAQVDSLLKKK